jgi:hypothetical protein
MNTKPLHHSMVGLPLVGTPSRDARYSRDGMATSASPTQAKQA